MSQPTDADGFSTGWGELDQPQEAEPELWLRWPADQVQLVRIVSSEPLSYVGHWWPALRVYRRCDGLRCRLCAEGLGRRTRHLAAVQLPNGQQRVWEFGKPTALQLRAITYAPAGDAQSDDPMPLPSAPTPRRGTLKKAALGFGGGAAGGHGADQRVRPVLGLPLLLTREGCRTNGKVLVQLDDAPPDWGPLPEALDVRGLVKQTWTRAALKDGKRGDA